MSETHATNERDANQDWLALVRTFVGSMRFGVVEIVIHEGRVTQIEKTERVRLAQPDSKSTRLKD